MDIKMLNHVKDTLPMVNKEAVDGRIFNTVEANESYVHECMTNLFSSFENGLRYCGWKRCTPEEQWRETVRQPRGRFQKGKHQFDLSKSNVYLCKYLFTYNGEPLTPRYLFLPDPQPGNLIHLMGTQYKIIPVIAGVVFNIEKGNIYLPTPLCKFGFWRFKTTCLKGNKTIYEDAVCSYLLNQAKKYRPNENTLVPCLLHYILAKHGLKETLAMFKIPEYQVGFNELDELDDNWVVYKSRQLHHKRGMYQLAETRIAIPKQYTGGITDTVISTIIYILDSCPESTVDVADFEKPNYWNYCLRKFIFKYPNDAKNVNKAKKHLGSIEADFDISARLTLNRQKVNVQTIYQLFHYLITRYNDTLIHHDVGSMYGLEITTTKYLMQSIVESLGNFRYRLKQIPPHLLSAQKINETMSMFINKDKIFNTALHGELNPVSIASDCVPFSSVMNLIPHSRAAASGRSSKGSTLVVEQDKLLHPSQLTVASSLVVTKSDIMGRNNINPFVHIEGGITRVNPGLKDDIKQIERLLKR